MPEMPVVKRNGDDDGGVHARVREREKVRDEMKELKKIIMYACLIVQTTNITASGRQSQDNGLNGTPFNRVHFVMRMERRRKKRPQIFAIHCKIPTNYKIKTHSRHHGFMQPHFKRALNIIWQMEF